MRILCILFSSILTLPSRISLVLCPWTWTLVQPGRTAFARVCPLVLNFKKYENEFCFSLNSFFGRRTTSAIDLLCGYSITKQHQPWIDKWFFLPTKWGPFSARQKMMFVLYWFTDCCAQVGKHAGTTSQVISDFDYISQIIRTLSFCVLRTRFYNWVENLRLRLINRHSRKYSLAGKSYDMKGMIFNIVRRVSLFLGMNVSACRSHPDKVKQTRKTYRPFVFQF